MNAARLFWEDVSDCNPWLLGCLGTPAARRYSGVRSAETEARAKREARDQKSIFGIAVIGAVVMAAEFGSTAVNAADPTDDLTMTVSPSIILLDNPADWGARKPS